jgi:hypothetical protein
MVDSSVHSASAVKKTSGFEVPMASRLYHPIKFNSDYSYNSHMQQQAPPPGQARFHQSSHISSGHQQSQQVRTKVRNVTVANAKNKRKNRKRRMPYYLKLKRNSQRVSAPRNSKVAVENHLKALVAPDGRPALSCHLHLEFS